MKIHLLLIKSLIISSLALSMAAQSETPKVPNSPDSIENPDGYGINLLPPPKLSATGESLFLSGGIGSDSLNHIKKLAPTFSLAVVLVERTNEYYRESYIADVRLNIKDKKGHDVLNTVTEGPYFLANLPSGNYQVTAEFNAIVKARTVMIKKNKHTRIVLLWDNRMPIEMH